MNGKWQIEGAYKRLLYSVGLVWTCTGKYIDKSISMYDSSPGAAKI